MKTTEMARFLFTAASFLIFSCSSTHAAWGMELNFYDKTCPGVSNAVKEVVADYISKAPFLAAPLLRMHFHDCFVRVSIFELSPLYTVYLDISIYKLFNILICLTTTWSWLFKGCDGSVLLNSTKSRKAEKDAFANLSLRGFHVIDAAKAAMEKVCPRVVSCVDILALIARDAVHMVTTQITQ